ncbi:hypothetical protein GCM10007079_48530 [Nocardiopsis terrae]|uniref:DnaJ-class molecular chaperone n=1 Tax=Nocardiopsis terrae TaxID=372655 RepID=A0ABR9HAH0_9ACTN|nr:DnaJ-class molecular chaperone [Nocardiopsis terrae]GHC96217.1 hypothetical protein GCM10007079_48530 [Nocardiopsis terrae]
MAAALARPDTTRPAPKPHTPAAPQPPTAAACGACNGQGGTWVTSDGSSPGKNISRWVACTACNGTGAT